MPIIMSTDELKSIPAIEVATGSIFVTVSYPFGTRGFYLRVKPEHEQPGTACVVSLSGEKPYMFETWEGETAMRHSLALPSRNIQIGFDLEAITRDDNVYKPGNLLVTDRGPLTVVSMRDSRGGETVAYVNLANGHCISDQPDHYSCFPKWDMRSRSADGTEVVLMKVGET